MSTKSNITVPSVTPLPPELPRPLWSVMIPSYNCAAYLRQTLESVLAQDPGAMQMQIEVVDDRSTRDDPEAVVREVGKGRVEFYRNPANLGATANFNACLARSRGQLVHVLHGDDYVLGGFYTHIERMAAANPEVAGFFARCFVIDDNGEIEALSPRIKHLEVPSRLPGELLYVNDIRTPGVVVRRRFYEESGGFLPHLVHVADWEMWLRCIRQGSGLFINKPLATYRFFAGNDTSTLAKTAGNLRDYLRLCSYLSSEVAGFDCRRFIDLVAGMAVSQRNRFNALQNAEAAEANHELFRELVPPTTFCRRMRLAYHAIRSVMHQY